MQTPAASGAMAAEEPAAADRAGGDELSELEHQLALYSAELDAFGGPPPLRGAPGGESSREEAEADAAARPKSAPAAAKRKDMTPCERICGLADAVCGLEERICALANEHEGEPRYAQSCERASEQCLRAREACDGCAQ